MTDLLRSAASSTTGDVLLVPWRGGDARRERAWSFCRRWWSSCLDAPIVEGASPAGPFSRSAALNDAARAAGDWSVALIVDADTIANVDQVDGALERARTTGRATLAYSRFAGLNRTGSDRVLGGYSGSWERWISWQSTETCSSALAVPRALWDALGGFDERFRGWGFEDRAFWTAAAAVGGGTERVKGTVWHLWHPVQPTRVAGSPTWRANAALATRYRAAARDRDAMLELLAEPREAAA